jgi:hypothetical protein
MQARLRYQISIYGWILDYYANTVFFANFHELVGGLSVKYSFMVESPSKDP